MGIFRFSIALGAILALVSLAELRLGKEATFTISFLTGLFELHGISLANATLFSQGQLTSDIASFMYCFFSSGTKIANLVCNFLKGNSHEKTEKTVYA